MFTTKINMALAVEDADVCRFGDGNGGMPLRLARMAPQGILQESSSTVSHGIKAC